MSRARLALPALLLPALLLLGACPAPGGADSAPADSGATDSGADSETGDSGGDSTSDSGDPCADPGTFTIDCTDADGDVVDHVEGSCESYAESGDQALNAMQATCEETWPGCTCTADVSECEFPCGSND